MNPFQAIMGGMAPQTPQMGAAPAAPAMPMGGIWGQVQQMANSFQNPQQLVQRYFPDAPSEVSGDPGQLLQWMQQTGKVNPQMIQMARQMMGGR